MTASVRPAIAELVKLGPLPIEKDVSQPAQIARHETLLVGLELPATDEEARLLAKLFPGYGTTFGLAWNLLHMIESAPGWPLADRARQRCVARVDRAPTYARTKRGRRRVTLVRAHTVPRRQEAHTQMFSSDEGGDARL
jgi:hypothetical protein